MGLGEAPAALLLATEPAPAAELVDDMRWSIEDLVRAHAPDEGPRHTRGRGGAAATARGAVGTDLRLLAGRGEPRRGHGRLGTGAHGHRGLRARALGRKRRR